MSSIIDRLLTLARADDGKEQLAFQEVNLGKLIQDLGTDAEILCREKGLGFHLYETHDLLVKGDEAMLRQLFFNLLDNAIKYTPSGGTVSVSIRTEGQMAVVAITDSGIGIAPEDILSSLNGSTALTRLAPATEGALALGWQYPNALLRLTAER